MILKRELIEKRPVSVFSLLSYILTGHPLVSEKKILWQNFVSAFIWNLWLECNARMFLDNKQSYCSFVESTSILGLSWSKLSSPFCNYSLSTFTSHWRFFKKIT